VPLYRVAAAYENSRSGSAFRGAWAESPAPVQVHTEQMDAELLERREEVRGLSVVGAAAVGDAAAQTG
jgi:hypothetical protein